MFKVLYVETLGFPGGNMTTKLINSEKELYDFTTQLDKTDCIYWVERDKD